MSPFETHACTIPTDGPEQEGTAEWDSATLVVAEVLAGAQTGARLHVRADGGGGPDGHPPPKW